MGTRSLIGRENVDGSIDAVYCHWDGYLSHNGRILLDHYDMAKLDRLIRLGDLSSLGGEIGEKHDFDKRPEGVCTFYNRDRDEALADTKARRYMNRREMQKHREEFSYIMDQFGVWHVAVLDREFVPLRQALLEKDSEE